MARSAATKTTTTKKSTTKAGSRKKTGAAALSREEHERLAYFNWLNRGAPIGDDQRDWFETTL
ncbi:MAG: DUF2934 domain-containing protein [bacterium]|nr:DUF2934 domain-containing protein [bacterium]